MEPTQIFVSNITMDMPDENGGHKIACDTDMWGQIERGVVLHLTQRQYESVIKEGWFVG